MPNRSARVRRLVRNNKSAKKTRGKIAYSLPEVPREAFDDVRRYVTLIYGRAGVGKSHWLASWPDCLILSTERITKGLQCFDFNWERGGCTSWDVFKEAVTLLRNNPDRFSTVGIDTIDVAYQYCLDYTCRKMGITHPGDAGYGSAWKEVKDEFTKNLQWIIKSGRGLVMTSHSREVEIVSHSGSKFTRIQPTMSGQCYGVLKGLTDFTFYAEFVRDSKGNNRRVLFTSGDEIIDAKSSNLPRFLPLTEHNGFEVLESAFRGEDVGIPANDILPAKSSGKATIAAIRQAAKKSGKPRQTKGE